MKKKIEIPWWGKMAIGALGIIALIKFTPIAQLMYLFAEIVLIPITFFISVTLLSQGAAEVFKEGWTEAIEVGKVSLQKKVAEKVNQAA